MNDEYHGPYTRVIPRDLFNESKLLKCMGQVALLNHEGKDGGRLVLQHKNPKKGFEIVQDGSDGSIYVRNLTVHLRDGRRVWMGTTLNSREPYPLVFNCLDECGSVFNDDGTFSDEFKALIGLA